MTLGSADSDTDDSTDELTDRGPIAGGPAALAEGDTVLWEGRSQPLVVDEPAHEDGEHSDLREVAAIGPRGGVVRLRKHKRDTGWQTCSDGAVSTVVIVDKGDRTPVTTDMDEPFTTAWDDPSDGCPHCGGVGAEFTTEDFQCHYVSDGLFGATGDDRFIERTDTGAPRRLIHAECIRCGGVVYQHPAYARLVTSDSTREF